MLQTKGTVMLRTSNYWNSRMWKWDDQTLEGAYLPKEMWESIPSDRLALAAREGLRYAMLHGPIVSGHTGRLSDDEIDNFSISVRDDGVYADFTVEGEAKQRLDNPPDDGSRYYYGIHMDKAWIGVLFSPGLNELKENLCEGIVSEALLAERGFRKTLWNASSATYSCGVYNLMVSENRILNLNF